MGSKSGNVMGAIGATVGAVAGTIIAPGAGTAAGIGLGTAIGGGAGAATGYYVGHQQDKAMASAEKAAKEQEAQANRLIAEQAAAKENAEKAAVAQRKASIASQSQTNYTTALGDTETTVGQVKKKTLLGG